MELEDRKRAAMMWHPQSALGARVLASICQWRLDGKGGLLGASFLGAHNAHWGCGCAGHCEGAGVKGRVLRRQQRM